MVKINISIEKKLAKDKGQAPACATLKEAIIHELKKVYDPELPVNIYDLGLIYNIEIDAKNNVIITMTLTAPTCPVADMIVNDIATATSKAKGVGKVKVNLVFTPKWDKSKISEAALVELGWL